MMRSKFFLNLFVICYTPIVISMDKLPEAQDSKAALCNLVCTQKDGRVLRSLERAGHDLMTGKLSVRPKEGRYSTTAAYFAFKRAVDKLQENC